MMPFPLIPNIFFKRRKAKTKIPNVFEGNLGPSVMDSALD